MVQLAHPVGQAERLRSLDHHRATARLLPRAPEELGESAVCLQVSPDHHRVVGLERLRHPIDQRPREPQRVADLADGRARPVGDEVADHPRVLRPVELVDILDDFLAPLRAEIDVDVRICRPALVDEPLEQQVVADRVDPGDPQDVGDDRIRRAAAPLRGDAALPGKAHQVPTDEEELGQAGPFDDVQLVGELPDHGRGQRVIATASARLAQLHEIAEWRLPARHRKARKAVLLETEIDRARRRQVRRCRDSFRPGSRRARIGHRERRLTRRQHRQLRAGLQIRLAVRSTQIAQHVERPAVPNRGQDVGQLAILGSRVMDVIGDHDGQPKLLGQGRRLRQKPVVVGQPVMRQLDKEAAAGRAVSAPEQRCVARRDGPGPGPIADAQPASQLPVATAGQRNQSFRVLGQERLTEARHALGASQVGPRHEPAETPPADLRAGEQDEVWTTGPFADPSQILLDRIAVTRKLSTRRARTDRQALVNLLQPWAPTRPAVAGRAAAWPARPDHDLLWIRDRRVQQLDLEADHWVDPSGLGGADEADRAVEPGVIRDGQPSQTQLDGPIDQVVRRGRPVEEREVGVAMELGVRELGHESPGPTG